MIETTMVNGKPATVAYLTRSFEPCEAEKAELVKIIYESGDISFAIPSPDTSNSMREAFDKALAK